MPSRLATAHRAVTALVATALATAGLLVAGPAAAAPVAPSGLTPQGSATAENPVLQWNRVSGATTYDVEVSSSASFTSTLYKVSTANRRATPTSQLPATAIHWRVRAKNSAGASRWAVASFTRTVGSGPALLDPEDGAALTQPGRPPLLRWQPVRGATGYTVEIDNSDVPDWVESKTYSTKTSAFVVPDPQENGAYSWRVTAQLGTGLNTDYSEERSYTVGPLPVVPDDDTTHPLDGETVQDVVFDWAPVPGAVSYDIRVATDNSFNDLVEPQKTIFGTRYSPTTTFNVDDYWWQVRARNIFGKAQEWTDVPIRTFRREWSESPTLEYPDDTLNPAVGDDLYFQWTPVHLATHYQLDLGTDRSFSPGSFRSCTVTQTTYAPGFDRSPTLGADRCMPTPGVTYYWRVKALDGPHSPEVNGVYSAIRTFVYDPGQVIQTSPADGSTVDTPTLTWEPMAGAEKYYVTLKYGTTTVTATTYSTSWTYTGTTRLDPAKGPFSWTVQGIDIRGTKTVLSLGRWRTFNLSGAADQSTGQTPLTPLGPSQADGSVRFPTLTWVPQPEAAYYRVYVATAGSVYYTPLGRLTNPTEFAYSAATDLTDDFFDAGRYDWFVKAFNTSGLEIGSGPSSTFTIDDLAPVSGQQVALSGKGLDTPGTPCTKALPADGTTSDADICTDLTATPVLDWNPVENASQYLVYVSRNRLLQNMVYGKLSDPTSLPKTSNTRWTPTETLPDSQAGVAYYWYVRPCKTQNHCSADPTEATHAFSKKSNVVQAYDAVSASRSTALTSYYKDEPSPTVANDVRFTWDDFLDSNQSRSHRDPTTGEQPDQAARGYHLQVSTSPAFSTLLDDVTVDQTTYTAWGKTYPEGNLYWRIQAVDGSGNGLSWSDAMPFTKQSPRPVLTSPVGSDVATGIQPFRWQPLPYAASYDLEIYRNGDTNASSTNRVLSVSGIKQVAYTLTTPLAADSAAYVWRVRRADADPTQRRGAWSDWSRFKVGGQPPALSQPSSGAFVKGNDTLFTWWPSDTAASYRFERRRSTDTYSAETVTTVGTRWAPAGTLSDGVWEWRVTPLDSAGRPVTSSSWRRFTVDSKRPTVTAKAPATTAKRTASFKATFSESVSGVSGTTMRLFRKGSATPVRGKVTVGSTKRTALLNPSQNLRAGATYVVRLTTGIKDRAGNPLVAPSWTVRVR